MNKSIQVFDGDGIKPPPPGLVTVEIRAMMDGEKYMFHGCIEEKEWKIIENPAYSELDDVEVYEGGKPTRVIHGVTLIEVIPLPNGKQYKKIDAKSMEYWKVWHKRMTEVDENDITK